MSEVDREREEDQPPRPSGLDPLTPQARPDWLIGADEGASEERNRVEAGAKDGPTMPGLIPLGRPNGESAPPNPTPALHWPGLPAPPSGGALSDLTGNMSEWLAPQEAPPPPREDPVEPMAPSFIRKPDEKSGMAAVAAWAAENDPQERIATAARPHLPKASVPSGSSSGSSRGSASGSSSGSSRGSMLDPYLTRQNLTIAALVGLIIIAAAIFFRPSGTATIALSRIRRDPARYDGTIVTVRGKIGEVFPMGSSYAYNLHQGRDTIVVFTRTHVPISHEKVTVVGSVSTGYLEGVPRAAIFEEKTIR